MFLCVSLRLTLRVRHPLPQIEPDDPHSHSFDRSSNEILQLVESFVFNENPLGRPKRSDPHYRPTISNLSCSAPPPERRRPTGQIAADVTSNFPRSNPVLGQTSENVLRNFGTGITPISCIVLLQLQPIVGRGPIGLNTKVAVKNGDARIIAHPRFGQAAIDRHVSKNACPTRGRSECQRKAFRVDSDMFQRSSDKASQALL